MEINLQIAFDLLPFKCRHHLEGPPKSGLTIMVTAIFLTAMSAIGAIIALEVIEEFRHSNEKLSDWYHQQR